MQRSPFQLPTPVVCPRPGSGAASLRLSQMDWLQPEWMGHLSNIV